MGKNKIIAGVIGDPISHSKSPLLFKHWFTKLKINGEYIPLKVTNEDLEEVLKALPKKGFRGLNVTIPHKERVLELAEIITPRAQEIGAANTLTFLPSGGFKADNTDGFGFLANLKENQKTWCAKNCSPLIIGSGGAARSVVSSLLGEGVPLVYISNRTKERAQTLQKFFGNRIKTIDWLDKEKILKSVNMLVNTTSLGMVGHSNLNLSLSNLTKKTTVIDLVYNPAKTQLLKTSEKKGLKTINGLGMLLHQATPGFQEWFGQNPVVDNNLKNLLISK